MNLTKLTDKFETALVYATREEIRKIFGDQVIKIVDGCTEWDNYPKPAWEERKRKYLENLRFRSSSVRLVSLADKLHNARCLLADYQKFGDEIWNKFNALLSPH